MNDEKLYAEIMQQIIERDANSFKLLAFVPTISGLLAFLTLWKDVKGIPLNTFIIVGLLGCALTFFVWRWECRNIQFCTVLRESAAKIEEKAVATGNLSAKPFADFRNMPRPTFLGIGMGKTESERGLYFVTMLLWLALPCIAYLIQQKPLL